MPVSSLYNDENEAKIATVTADESKSIKVIANETTIVIVVWVSLSILFMIVGFGKVMYLIMVVWIAQSGKALSFRRRGPGFESRGQPYPPCFHPALGIWTLVEG